MAKLNKLFFKNSISKRLLKIVLSIYFSLTFVVTSVHIYLEYYSAKHYIQEELERSEETFSNILALDLWNYDLVQLEVTAKSIANSPSISGIIIENMKGKALYINGVTHQKKRSPSGRFGYEYSLFFEYEGDKHKIGTVKLFSDTKVVFNRIKVSVYTLLINAVIKTVALVVLVVIFFNRLLTKPLGKLAADAEDIDLNNIKNKKIIVKSQKGDELSVLEVALNNMLDKINASILELNELNRKLELRVNERTVELDLVIEKLGQDQELLNVEVSTRKKSETELKNSLEELKKAQNQLIEAEKMASLGALVAGVAHEINTPIGLSLTGISHFEYAVEQLAKQFAAGELEEDQFKTFLSESNELAKTIHISLARAANLVKSFKQVAVDQSHDQLRDFDIIEYLSETMLSLSNKLKQTSVKFETTHQIEHLNVKSFPGCWAQIFTNLIQNSLIHGYTQGDKGLVTLCISRVEECLTFVFEDDGKGMDEKTAGKIFDPFFTTNREGGGSGLGLNIIYNIITQKMQGSISVESKLGKGTRFIIKTPLRIIA